MKRTKTNMTRKGEKAGGKEDQVRRAAEYIKVELDNIRFCADIGPSRARST